MRKAAWIHTNSAPRLPSLLAQGAHLHRAELVLCDVHRPAHSGLKAIDDVGRGRQHPICNGLCGPHRRRHPAPAVGSISSSGGKGVGGLQAGSAGLQRRA